MGKNILDTSKNYQSQKKLQGELIDTVRDNTQITPSYLVLLVFSAIIATLGLLIDSTAVVIGAMLIAPLFWPILGLTLSLTTTKGKLITRSILSLSLSIFLVVFLSFLVSKTSPITEVTDQILSRTQPTLLDLLIALASSVVGVLAVYNPKISSSTTGVAISIAILPPLSVLGIGLANLSPEIIIGSSLLFGANLSAMMFAGIVTLYFLHFNPRRKKDINRFGLGFLLSSFLVVALSVPLMFYLEEALTESRIKKTVNHSLKTNFSQISPQSIVEDIQVSFPLRNHKTPIIVRATALLPENDFLTFSDQDQIINQLSQAIEHPVDLKLNIVNTLHLRNSEDEQTRELKQVAVETTKQLLEAYILPEYIDSIKAQHLTDQIGQDLINLTVFVNQSSPDALTYSQKESIRAQLESTLQKHTNLDVFFLTTSKVQKQNQLDQLNTRINQELESQIARLFKLQPDSDFTFTTSTSEIEPDSMFVRIQIQHPDTIQFSPTSIDYLEDKLQAIAAKPVTIQIDSITYKTFSSQ